MARFLKFNLVSFLFVLSLICFGGAIVSLIVFEISPRGKLAFYSLIFLSIINSLSFGLHLKEKRARAGANQKDVGK